MLLKIVVIVVGCAVLYSVFFLSLKIVRVKHVECSLTTQESCSAELNQSLSPLIGKSMFFEDFSSVLTNPQTTQQPVTFISLEKKLPNTVHVLFKPEQAAYLLVQNDSQEVISETGKASTGNFDTSQLLILETEEPVISDQGFIDTEVHHTLMTIKETATDLQLPLNKVFWLDKSTIKLSIDNREEQFILDSESPRLELYKVSLVLKSNEYRDITEQKVELDARFNMPVLRTQP